MSTDDALALSILKAVASIRERVSQVAEIYRGRSDVREIILQVDPRVSPFHDEWGREQPVDGVMINIYLEAIISKDRPSGADMLCLSFCWQLYERGWVVDSSVFWGGGNSPRETVAAEEINVTSIQGLLAGLPQFTDKMARKFSDVLTEHLR